MDEDEDDFYGSGAPAATTANGDEQQAQVKDEHMVSEEEDDSEDDIEFTLEKPDVPKQESARPTSTRPPAIPDRAESVDAKPSRSTPAPIQESTAPQQAVKGALTHNGKEGKDFPDIRTSEIDLEGNPIWPGNNKSILEIEMDADLAENSKLWRLPGTDQTDYFNYGFDEYTWTQYQVRQQQMMGIIATQKDEDAKLKEMLATMPGMGAMGGSMPAMPGMPNMDDWMAMGGGDFNSMNMMGGGGAQQGNGGYGNQGGYGQSPHPQGQGFQAPTGPGKQQGQQERMGSQGGGAGRGRRGGRGGYF